MPPSLKVPVKTVRLTSLFPDLRDPPSVFLSQHHPSLTACALCSPVLPVRRPQRPRGCSPGPGRVSLAPSIPGKRSRQGVDPRRCRESLTWDVVLPTPVSGCRCFLFSGLAHPPSSASFVITCFSLAKSLFWKGQLNQTNCSEQLEVGLLAHQEEKRSGLGGGCLPQLSRLWGAFWGADSHEHHLRNMALETVSLRGIWLASEDFRAWFRLVSEHVGNGRPCLVPGQTEEGP